MGVCLVFVTLFLSDQIVTKRRYEEMREERDEWKRTADLERTRSDANVATGQIVRDVMLSLRKELKLYVALQAQEAGSGARPGGRSAGTP